MHRDMLKIQDGVAIVEKLNWSCLIRDVTLRNVSCNVARIYLQVASFNWLRNRNITRQVARGMSHCGMAEKGNRCEK